MSEKFKSIVVIPTYDEADNIAIASEALRRVLWRRWETKHARPSPEASSGRGRRMRPRDLAHPDGLVLTSLHHLTPEVRDFLLVGGAGFVVDVACFNLLRSLPPWSTADPAFARTLAVVAAIWVTYVGNRRLTWRDHATHAPDGRRREVMLFFACSIIGFGISLLTLVISHDVLGLTSRLADNISANGIGLALGTAFRFITYKHIVFRISAADPLSGRSVEARQPARS